MVSIVQSKSPRADRGEPAWDIARLFPDQGFWDEGDYLALDTNHLVEFTDGFIEVLPMPTPAHQRILIYLFDELRALIRPDKRGEALLAPMPVRLRSGKFREPDVIFMLAENSARKSDEFWNGADLVIEIVSPDPQSHERDYAKKRVDYAEAGISEYWIVDPAEKRIIILTLHRGEYIVHAEAGRGQRAASLLLSKFSVNVDDVFAAAEAG